MSWTGRIYMAGCVVFIALPILVVCGAALNGGRTMLFPPEDPTLDRFVEFFVTEDVWIRSLQNSIVIALCSATLAVLIAWPLAHDLWRRDTRASRLLASLTALPFVLPPIVFGAGLGFFWSFGGVLGHLWVAVLSHAALFAALPLVTISIEDLQGHGGKAR